MGAARVITRTLVVLAWGGIGLSAAAADAPARERFECRIGTARWASAHDAGGGLALTGIRCQSASQAGAGAVASAAAEAANRATGNTPVPAVQSWRPMLLVVAPARDTAAANPAAGSEAVGASVDRSGGFSALSWLVRETALRAGLDPDLAHAVAQVESNLDPVARSPRGALGLMQIMPSTASDLGVRSRDELLQPATNVRLGVAYLLAMLERFAGHEELALAAYNAGPAAVQRAGMRVPPYAETRRYVDRVLAVRASLRRASGAPWCRAEGSHGAHVHTSERCREQW